MFDYNKVHQVEIYSFFLADHRRQIISDEIYAGSQVKSKNEFVSALTLDAYKKNPDRIHVTWGLSKDFGLAGFRLGFMISQSPALQTALQATDCLASLAWSSPFVASNIYITKMLFLNNDGEPD